MIVQHIAFKEILPVWKNYLWPNNTGHYKKCSSMIFGGGIDLSIYDKYTPHFFGIFDKNKNLIAVNSGHKTSDYHYRSRGLYVKDEYRNNGYAKLLLKEAAKQAKNQGCLLVWACPRETARHVYLKANFWPIPNTVNNAHTTTLPAKTTCQQYFVKFI